MSLPQNTTTYMFPNQPTHEEVEAFIDKHWEQIVADIAQVVSIPSTEDPATKSDDKPFGEAVNQALNCGMNIAARLGLEAYSCDGYLVFADLPTASLASNTSNDSHGVCRRKQIATIAHLDVVPAGPGWDTDPFVMQRREGYLVGRGVLDDKGPAILTLWVAHFFTQPQFAPIHTLRILLGGNEETGMADARYYQTKHEAPDFLFTPDSSWPVVCGEKGSYNALISFPLQTDGRIVSIEAGTVRNAVAAHAEAVVRATPKGLSAMNGVTVCSEGDGLVRLVVEGIGGHAAMPEGTCSAIGILVQYLLDNGIFSPSEKSWLEFQQLMHNAWDGSLLGIDAMDDIFDPLTIVSGVMHTQYGKLIQTVDSRYPKSTTPDAICAQLQKVCAQYGLEFEEVRRGKYVYVDPQSFELQILLDSYAQWTGERKKPVTLGGGTYAKHFPYAVAFGPEEDSSVDQPEWVGSIHGPHEAIKESSLKRALAIYITALAKLLNTPLE
ncbi:Sapep family Mn(2+)-dependent dipeptidase [Atopobium fossor]|uniref:Sapep family Mn(2+)-dependent dipeptidase n=1 Tax=Atopobium fossor TaxID=39487 RepID=UPI0004178738|nr:Sapep family Mn(2+)-dependent dipeptidase [Atopobium fossor]